MSSKKNIHEPSAGASAPLLSWDVFMEGYNKTLALADDFRHLNQFSSRHAWKQEWDIEEYLFRRRNVILVTNLSLQIVYASSNVFDMNGYLPKEITGKTPSMFQGKDTDAYTKAVIRQAITAIQPFNATIINYKKTGEAYKCNIEAFPVFNKQQKPVHFIAFENTAHAI